MRVTVAAPSFTSGKGWGFWEKREEGDGDPETQPPPPAQPEKKPNPNKRRNEEKETLRQGGTQGVGVFEKKGKKKKTFVPVVEEAVDANGKIRLLAHFHDFHGWDAHALWDDIKPATKHRTHIERLALVGEKKWEKWMALICKPFTLATVKYFDAADLPAAWHWVREGG